MWTCDFHRVVAPLWIDSIHRPRPVWSRWNLLCGQPLMANWQQANLARSRGSQPQGLHGTERCIRKDH